MPTAPTKRVAAAIRGEMARKGFTQTDLAEALGTSQSAISRRLAGEVPLDVDELDAIAGFLSVPAESLLAGAA